MTEPIEHGRGGSFLDGLGPRAARRAEPRASIAVAGAGCALAVLGVLIISGDTGAGDGDEFNQWPGALLSAAVVAAGLFTLARVRTGAIATGGAVAAALGVPPLMFFLTWDEGGFPPYSTDGILIVSTIAWLGLYLWGPGRGRPFFLGAGLIGLWATILELVEGVFDAPWTLFGGWAGYGPVEPGFEDVAVDGGPFGMGTFDPPDPTTMGVLSLVLGLAYLFATRRLDGRRLHGSATPFAAATVPVLVTVPFLLADELEAAGTGLLVMALGAAVAVVGSSVHRRGLTWLGGAGVAIGAATFLGDMTDDATIGGMLFLAAGIGLVFAGHAWAAARDEPDEMLVTSPAAAEVLAPAITAPAEVAADDAPDHSAWAPPPPPPPPPAATPPVEPSDADDTTWAPPTTSDDEDPPPPTT